MSINLKKGQRINLSKEVNNLSTITIGLGWDVAKAKPKGFWGSMTSEPVQDFDLDAIAFLLGADGKVHNTGCHAPGTSQNFTGGDIVFYNNIKHSSGAVYSTGDDRTGGSSENGDDEQIIVDINKLPSEIKKIAFVDIIYQGQKRKQYFGNVSNAYIRAVDANGKEILRYNLSDSQEYAHKCSLIFAEVEKVENQWEFHSIGDGFTTDKFSDILRSRYL